MEIKNLRAAAKKIVSSAKKGEQIVIFSDSDVDGVTSAIILEEAIKNIGGSVSFVVFSDKEDDDYGLSKKAIKELKKYSPALLVLLDLGVGNVKEVGLAKKEGFEVVIIDHHEVMAELPEADIIVDPKQEGDDYPFKNLAACGVTMKLAKIMIGDNFTGMLENSFLELAALGTIADKMPQLDENLEIIKKGLGAFLETKRPGLRVFLDMFLSDGLSLKESIQKIGQIIQITPFDKKNKKVLAYKLLSLSDNKEAEKIMEKLISGYNKRKEKIKKIEEKIINKLEKSKNDNRQFIFEGGGYIALNFIGALASRLSAKFGKPAFIYGENKERIIGSVRAPKEVNVLGALSACSQFLRTFGGHPPAAGFSIKKGKVKNFNECLNNYFGNKEK